MASFVMRGKQYVVAIVAEDGLLRAETLRFADELRTPKSIGLPEVEEVSAAKVKAMRTAIDHEKKATVPDKELADTYWQRLEALVEKKQKKNEDIVHPEGVEESDDDNMAEVIDLVAILKKSLGQKGGDAEGADEPKARTSTKARAKTRSAARAPKKAAPKKAAAKKRATAR
jgi:DNA end-binding protein Ku